jgi:hypothetical protein
MDVEELRSRAKSEVDELGPVPANPREHELWIEERRGAAVLIGPSAVLLASQTDPLPRVAHHGYRGPATRVRLC